MAASGRHFPLPRQGERWGLGQQHAVAAPGLARPGPCSSHRKLVQRSTYLHPEATRESAWARRNQLRTSEAGSHEGREPGSVI